MWWPSMTEQIENPEEEVIDPPQEEQIEEPQGPSEDQIAEAKKYGWRAKDEFDLAPDGWVDADRFLDLPSTEVKRLRDESREREAAFEARLKRSEAMAEDARKRALEQAAANHKAEMDRITAEQRAAVEESDLERFDVLEKRRAEMGPPEAIKEPERQASAIVDRYKDKYPWIAEPEKGEIAYRIIQSHPTAGLLPEADQVAFADREMKRLYGLDEQPKPRPKPRVAKTDPGGLGGIGGRGTASLPPEALSAGKKFVEQGLYKDLGEYAKVYHEQG